MNRIHHYLVLAIFLPFITGCAKVTTATNVEPIIEVTEHMDNSCSYFYFLWGTHSEYNQRFEEALEAYEKALICDPAATHIEKKLPVLLFRLGQVERASEWLEKAIISDPDDVSQYLLLAHLNIQQSKRDEAIALYQEVLKRDPGNESVQLRLGILTAQQNRFDEAEEIFRGLMTGNPDLNLARIYLARLLHMRGKSTEAANHYEEALTKDWSPDLVFEMVDYYGSLEQYEDVLRLYDTVLQNDSTNQRAVIGRIQALLNLGRDAEALAELREIRSQQDETERIDLAIAKVLLRLGKIDEAKAVLVDLRSGETGPQANYLLGLIAFQAQQEEAAVDYLAAIPPGAEEYTDGMYLQVRILRDLNRFDRAVQLLSNAVQSPASHHPLFYALLSSLYTEQAKTEQAMASITAGLVAFPESEQLHFEHALLLDKAGLQQEALAAMQRVLDIAPDHPEALNYIGYTWADQNVNLAQAYEYIRRAVDLMPENGFIRDSLGWVHYRLGNYDSALKELLQALELAPDDPHVYVHLGDVYRALNRLEEARDAYLKGLKFTEESEKNTVLKKIDELPKN